MLTPKEAGAAREAGPSDRLKAARERLIVALDVPDAAAADALVRRIEGACRWFKVGLELFVAAEPSPGSCGM